MIFLFFKCAYAIILLLEYIVYFLLDDENVK